MLREPPNSLLSKVRRGINKLKNDHVVGYFMEVSTIPVEGPFQQIYIFASPPEPISAYYPEALERFRYLLPHEEADETFSPPFLLTRKSNLLMGRWTLREPIPGYTS